MSQIDQIIDAVSEIVVTTPTVTPVLFDLSNARNSVMGTPARVVFPMQLAESEGGTVRASFGSSPTLVCDWTIADILLHTPVNKTNSLHMFLRDLAGYAGRYKSVFRTNMSLMAGVTIEQIRAEWGVFEFPAESGLDYYGCLIQLDIKEIVQDD